MNSALDLGAGLIGGAGLAFFFFGTLWLTVKRIPDSPRPRLVFWGSFLGRFGCCLAGFWALLHLGAPSLAGACMGFYLTRMILVPRVGFPERSWAAAEKRDSY